MARKILSLILSLGLLFQQSGMVYAVGELNLANYLSSMHSAMIQPDYFRPPQLRYISYDLKSDDFKLLLDKGDLKQPKEQNELKDKLLTQELLNYFLIGLSLPNDTFWVNLRPDAADNIIDPLLEKTDIGRIFLESDLQLKKDTASFTSPQTPEGKAYWDKLYKKAGELFGSENITIPTITRPWIVPNEVIVRETEDSAYIYKATLKVMLEQDHLKDSVAYNFSDPRLKELNEYSSQLIRETIIPKLTKEINSSQRYAKLRQVYYSLVLSRWFKMKYKGKPGEYPELIDRQSLTNLTSKQAWDKQTYFSQYQESFAKGEYNLKETIASGFGQSIRSYVSGGISVGSPISEGVVKVYSPVAAVTEALTRSVPAPVAAGSPIIVDKSDAGRLSAITLNSGLSVRLNGWNAETLREVLRAGQPVDIVVFPPELYRNGIEYGSPEFLVYYNLFFAPADNDAPINLGWRRGNYTFLVAQNKEQKEAIEMIVTRSFLGSPREFYEGIMNGAINIKGISPEDIRSSDIEHFMQNRAMFPTVGEKLEIGQFVKVHILGEEFDYKTKAGSNLKLKIERDDNGRYKITETGNGQDLVYQNIIADEYRLPVTQSIAVTNVQIDAHNFLNRPEFGYTILGDSHGFDPDGNNTSILVSVGGKYLLIDGSPATYQITKDLKIPSLDIEYVYLTHTHDDHDAILSRVLNGVPVKLIATPAVYANFVAKAKDKLKLYGQDINIDEWVDYIKILPGQKLPIFNGKAIIECPSFYNKHTVPTSAVKIGYVGQGENIENSIAYTADTQLDLRLLQFAEESNVIFHDAGVLPLHPSPGGLDKQITDEQLRRKLILVHASKKDIEKAGKINLSKGDLLKSTSLIPADFSERAKNNDNIRECLAAVAYLSSLSPEALQALTQKTKVRNFLPGDKIVKQGETIQYLQPSRDVLYLIVSGEAKVNIGGKEIRLKPGMTFGEFSAVNPLQPRSVDVVAGDNGLVAISFSKATILALIKDFPEVRESVERIQHNLLYLEKLSEIEKSPFNQLPIEVLYDLAEKLKVVEFEKGKDILIEGEQSGSEGAYIITEGQVEVTSKSGGKLKEIYNSSPDNVVGEGVFFAPESKRNATVTTVTKVKALHIAFDDFQKALEHHPSLKYKFYVLSANRRDENNNNGHQLRKMASVASPLTLEVMKSIVLEQGKILLEKYSSFDEKREIEDMVINASRKRTKKALVEFVSNQMIFAIDKYLKERNEEGEEELRSKNFEAYKEVNSKKQVLLSVKEALALLIKEGSNYSASPVTSLEEEVEDVLGKLSDEEYNKLSTKRLSLLEKINEAVALFASKVNRCERIMADTNASRETLKLFKPGMGFNIFVSEKASEYLRAKNSLPEYRIWLSDARALKHRLQLIEDEKKKASASPLTAQEFISAVDLIEKTAEGKKISYKVAFNRILEIVPQLKEGELIPYKEITGKMYYIIHNGNPDYPTTLLEDIKELVLRKKPYTREGFLDMIEKELKKSRMRIEQKVEKDVTLWIGALTALLGKDISKYEEKIKNIKSRVMLSRIKAAEFNDVNEAMRKKTEFDYNDMLGKAGVSLFGVQLLLSEIDKYNEFLLAVDETRQAISNGPKSSSSLVVSQESSQDFATLKAKKVFGGIDLTDRAMHIKLERVGSFASFALVLPEIANVEALDLDKEFEQIQAMIGSNIRPSDVRILEFAAACYYKDEFDQRLAQVSSCIKAAHLADERLGRESSDTLRLATMLPDALYAYGGS